MKPQRKHYTNFSEGQHYNDKCRISTPSTHNIVKPQGTMHQVIIYTLEAKASHKIGEAQKAQRVKPWEQAEKNIGYQEKE